MSTFGFLAVLAILGQDTTTGISYDGTTLYDDFHYPAEELTEAAALRKTLPTLTAISGNTASLSAGGSTATVSEGDVAFGTWHVRALLVPSQMVVLEAKKQRWGQTVYLSKTGPVATLRMSVGELAGIVQPRFNFTSRDSDYFTKVTSDLGDYPSKVAVNLSKDGEYSYATMASALAPQRDIVAIGNAVDVVKMVVTHAGRVKCGSRANSDVQNEGGIVELINQHTAYPDAQTVLFDPADHLTFWPEVFENSKTGLVGGSLNVANVGSYSASVGKGFELVAFVPTAPTTEGVAATEGAAEVPCVYTPALNNSFIADWPSHVASVNFPDLKSAMSACDAALTCGGVTLRPGSAGPYELRANSYTEPSPNGETSWLITNASKAVCHALPRISGINYDPAVYVALREQSGSSWNAGDAVKFFAMTNTSATNKTAPQPITSTEFYTSLLLREKEFSSLFSGAMTLSLPGSDGQRQIDMAAVGMLSSLNNYIGNQSNYGFGATYWSYGREDNGSLPLNWLSVDDALLDWGVCDITKNHMGFFFDNYIRPSGEVDYYTWGGAGDSVGVYGRLVDMYLKIGRLCDCESDGWSVQHLPAVESIGSYMLALQAKQRGVPAPAYATNLLQGAPEHDWSGTKDLYFYNNNVWVMRGMDLLGKHLSMQNVSLGAALSAGSEELHDAIVKSVSSCEVQTPSGSFLPPYAEANAKPYGSMTESREASYSNFRFFSEPLLASVLPADVESGWLNFHNQVGGRLGGTSRWSTHLDDMPTAGWGYGAIQNNKTADFLALLYGHMASYQSRGGFHSTEQLSYLGEGRYRSFLHFADPDPGVVEDVSHSRTTPTLGAYFASEQDVSFCIVSEVLVSRLTRWQVVFEDFYRDPTVWLGRGAPSRWFLPLDDPSSGGFAVANAPISIGRVSYNVTLAGPSTFIYDVTVAPAPGKSPKSASSVPWAVHFPVAGATSGVTATCVTGCSVDSVDNTLGSVRVAASASHFVIQGVLK